MCAQLEDSDTQNDYKFPSETYGDALKVWAKEQSARHLDELDNDQDLVKFTEL
jgi:hypothetical protein